MQSIHFLTLLKQPITSILVDLRKIDMNCQPPKINFMFKNFTAKFMKPISADYSPKNHLVKSEKSIITSGYNKLCVMLKKDTAYEKD